MRNLHKLEPTLTSDGWYRLPTFEGVRDKEYIRKYLKIWTAFLNAQLPNLTYSSIQKTLITDGNVGYVEKLTGFKPPVGMIISTGTVTHPLNHFRRLKRAYNKGGQEGLINYIANLKAVYFPAPKNPTAKTMEERLPVEKLFSYLHNCILMAAVPIGT